MTPSEIKAALSALGGGANKKLGQHFLVDPSALAAIIEAADIKKGEHVLEIGPGLGVLTAGLLEQGARVTAIEQDRRFVSFHEKRGVAGLDVTYADAAKLDWMPLVGKKPWKFVSNLPYSITSLALRKALWPAHRSSSEGGNEHPPELVVALVQREVAERAVAKDGKTSLLSLMVALASREARIVKRVPAGAFYPPPKVESAILKIVPMGLEERLEKWGIEPEKIMALAKKGFAHPRKLLASNLGVKGEALLAAGIPEKARAEDLSPEAWARLAL